jgi:hypothetical protein
MANLAIRIFLAVVLLLAGFLYIKRQAWENYAREFDRLYEENKFTQAIPVLKKQIQVAEEMLFLRRFFEPFSLNALGTVYYAQDDFVNAELYYKKAVALAESSFGLSNPRLIPLYENLVKLYETTANKKEKAKYLGRIKIIESKIRNKSSPLYSK